MCKTKRRRRWGEERKGREEMGVRYCWCVGKKGNREWEGELRPRGEEEKEGRVGGGRKKKEKGERERERERERENPDRGEKEKKRKDKVAMCHFESGWEKIE
jgi:hypothetical protein